MNVIHVDPEILLRTYASIPVILPDFPPRFVFGSVGLVRKAGMDFTDAFRQIISLSYFKKDVIMIDQDHPGI